MVKVDYSQIDLIPPVGASAGLPLSLRWKDSYSDAAASAPAHDGWAIFDTGLWKDKWAHSAAVGTQMNVVANVPYADGGNAQDYTSSPSTYANGGYTLIEVGGRSAGSLMMVAPPRYNQQWGSLDSSQLVQLSGDSFWAGQGITNDFPFVTLTSAELGRYVGLGRRIRTDNPRPGNGSWQDYLFHEADTRLDRYQPYLGITCDTMIGRNARAGGATYPSQVEQQNHITCTTHYTAVDYPSGGFGRQWGNVHDGGHQTSLAVAAYDPTASPTETGFAALFSEGGLDDALRYPNHWTVNLASFSRLTWSGATPSGIEGWRTPNGQTAHTTIGKLGEAETFIAGRLGVVSTVNTPQTDYAPEMRTVQALAVYDQLSSISTDSRGAGSAAGVHAIGRPDLGNSVVMDSAGLVGYDGVITVTAFGSITKNANSDSDDATASKVYTNGQLYGGLNIQVHSGLGAIRNGMAIKYQTSTPSYPQSGDLLYNRFLYGSDGEFTQSMSDALKTSASRKINNGASTTVWEETQDSNKTTFFNFRQAPGSGVAQPIGSDTSELFASSQHTTTGNVEADRLLGDDHAYGTSWTGTNKLTCAWAAEKIPTKVEVIPSVVGYTEITVTPGAAKLAAYPSAGNITFRKPIVDYHILVSLVHENQLGNRTAELDPKTGTGALMGTGSTPLARNAPAPALLEFLADYHQMPCEIWHGIVRINPDKLEQVYIDPAHSHIASFNETSCPTMVVPRHDHSLGVARQGWGLHQVTPFRPLANGNWSRVPRLCAVTEAGGFHQKGGISHIWDADVYGGELFVGADVMRCEDLSPSGLTSQTNPTDGQPEWRDSIWKRGQISLMGAETPHLPTGSELLIFKYSPTEDPWYPGMMDTSRTRNELQTQVGNWIKAGTITNNLIDSNAAPFSTAYSEINSRAGYAITLHPTTSAFWDVNDWVFPQVELMAYLGQEDKGNMNSDGSTPLHPTLHCSSLRIMEDGKMMMAAIHRDNIKSPYDMPSATIGNPYNPDTGGGQCPAGYYQQGNECKPILGSGGDSPPPGLVIDPITQQNQQPPKPSGGGGGQTSNTSVFGLVPSWSTLLANTSARSLIILWSDAAQKGGKVRKGRCDFGLDWNRVADGTSAGVWVAKERWHIPDTWWSGARISYWYPESAQRAIPISYGCYPETRLAYATLPRSLPWIDKDNEVRHGYPYRLTHDRTSQGPSAAAEYNSYIARTDIDTFWATRYKQLTIQRFIPTTPSFADMGAGSNPHQELGRSGWSFKAGLFDPIGWDATTYTFSDDPEKLISTSLPRNNGAPFAGFAGYAETVPDTAHQFNAIVYDFGKVLDPSFGWQLTQLNVAAAGGPIVNTCITPPLALSTMPQLIIDMMDPTKFGLTGVEIADYMPVQPTGSIEGYPYSLGGTGWTGFAILFETIGGVNNPPTHDFSRFGTLQYDDGAGTLVDITPQLIVMQGNGTNLGTKAGWSHFGPLHYGSGSSGHPYRVDRVWSVVHGGLGYDVPLHLLAPGPVQVRARAGSTNSLDLEMETPFHRTDRTQLEGLKDYYDQTSVTGFDLAGTGKPGGTRDVLGQYYLRTNLWEAQTNHATNAPFAVTGSTPHGPAGAGTYLTPFWDDHPTDRFHAGAIPVNIGNDIDLSAIQSLRYPLPNVLNADEWSPLDAVSLSEQLQSSVDVHVSKTTKPFWDSGSIVTAQGVGYGASDTISGQYAADTRQLMSGDVIPGSLEAGGLNWDSPTRICYGLGHGQRILRTPDGTLHTFAQRRSAQVPSGSQLFLPVWNHYKKPLFSDMFFNRKSLTTNPATDTYTGNDEVNPILQGAESSLYSHTRLCGAAFAADSDGTIHAIGEYSTRTTMAAGKPGVSSDPPAHNLYYTYAKRVLVTNNPEPVYDWDWNECKAVLGGYGGQVLNPNADIVGIDDLRQPSLVCDAEDRLHLVCTRPTGPNTSEIWYCSKLADEPIFPEWSEMSSQWQKVSLPDASGTNVAANGPHSVDVADFPKVCLRGDSVPVVFYRGCTSHTTEAGRNTAAVYVNVGAAGSAVNDPSGRFSFDATKTFTCAGLAPFSGVHSTASSPVNYYDAIIDEYDRAYVVATKTVSAGAGTSTLTTFSTRLTLSEQYTSTQGLGSCRTLYYIRAGTGHILEEPTLTTDGDGNIHLVMSHFLNSNDPNWFGLVMRDTSKTTDTALWPIQFPGIPSGDYSKGSASDPGEGGYGGTSADTEFPIGSGGQPGTVPAAGEARHLVEMWWPSLEFDHDTGATDMVLRSLNMRWLSVPSLSWDTTNGWQPISSAQTMAGHEDFPHYGPQLRYQRFWGHSAADLDMTWLTNELGWLQTMHPQSQILHPYGMSAMYGWFDETEEGIGIPAYFS